MRPIALLALATACAASSPATHTAAPHPAPAPTADSADSQPPAIPSPGPDAQRTTSGVRFIRHAGPGTGASPDADDDIVARYELTNEAGVVVARSSPSGAPATLAMGRLPPGWVEIMTQLRPGDRAQIWIPAALGFDEADTGPTGSLYVVVELVDVVPQATSPVATLPIAAPPDDAIRTASGLAYVYVRHGTGTTKPRPGGRVRAHYTGWHTDGSKFDSSHDRNEPIEFGLDQVIAGWTEALQLMVEGDLIRVWIPESLAYQGRPGRPGGTLVFDIELLSAR